MGQIIELYSKKNPEERIISSFATFLITILFWLTFYFLECRRGSWISDSIFVQTLLGAVFLYNGTQRVPFGEYRLLLTVFENPLGKMRSGLYFFPLFWIWGRVLIPEEFIKEEKSLIRFDAKYDTFFNLNLEGKSGVRYSLFRRYLLPHLDQISIKSVFFALFFGFGLAYGSVWLKYHFFNPYILQKDSTRKEKKVDTETTTTYTTTSVPIAKEEQTKKVNNYTQKNNSSPAYDDTVAKKYPSDTAAKYNTYDSATLASNTSAENMRRELSWMPPQDSISHALTYDGIFANDKYSIFAHINGSVNYIRIRGSFITPEESDNYLLHVYVDGYNGDNKFFAKFFMVHINELRIFDGRVYKDFDMPLSKYLEIVEDLIRPDEDSQNCYRDIIIKPKPNFLHKIRWHIVDAGIGFVRPFKLMTEDGQYITSSYDASRYEIPRTKLNPLPNSPKQNQNND